MILILSVFATIILTDIFERRVGFGLYPEVPPAAWVIETRDGEFRWNRPITPTARYSSVFPRATKERAIKAAWDQFEHERWKYHRWTTVTP